VQIVNVAIPHPFPRAARSYHARGYRSKEATSMVEPVPWGREAGQTLAEYALILALIAILAVLALLFLGAQINTLLSNVGNSI
jgi:Flp pilus assembly pilin Flp